MSARKIVVFQAGVDSQRTSSNFVTPLFVNNIPPRTPLDSLGFVHRFLPAPSWSASPVLLLLHGTGGNEDDLLELGRNLLPGAALLSPRGKILENGMPRFFRRLAEGVFDEKDLIRRTHELADFVEVAAKQYQFDSGRVVAVGYSNGANIAASMLLLRPEILSGAVLFRAMVPLEPEALPDLSGRPVLLAAGRNDPIVPPENAEQLAAIFQKAGADVSMQWVEGGHQLTAAELELAKRWLQEAFAS
jgi:predicted esterase